MPPKFNLKANGTVSARRQSPVPLYYEGMTPKINQLETNREGKFSPKLRARVMILSCVLGQDRLVSPSQQAAPPRCRAGNL